MKKSVLSLIFFFYFFVNTQCYSNWLETNFKKNITINCLGVDSSNILIVSTNNGFNLSFNAGKLYIDYPSLNNYYNKIRVLSDNIICISSFSFLALSTNSGEIWESLTFGIANPTSICLSKSNIYFSSSIGDKLSGGVFRNTDIFSDWNNSLNNGLPIENDSIKALDIISKNDTLFVALSNGLYYSTNEAGFWEPVQFFDGLEVDKFVLNSKNDLYFIVSGTEKKSGLYKNLEKVFDGALPLSAVAINRNDDVFVSSIVRGKGVFWTSDIGTDWQEMYDGLDSSEVTALICDMEGYIYAGTNGKGIYKSLKSTSKVEEINTDKLSVLPNPFPNKTKISFNLEEPSNTKITIFNSLGYILDVLADEYLSEGTHEFTFNGSALASGTYYFVLQANGKVETGQLILIK